MGIKYPQRKKQDHLGVLLRGADSVLPLREDRVDEYFDVLSPVLEDAPGLQGDESQHQETDHILPLLEENARLRILTVKLSNILRARLVDGSELVTAP